MGTVSTEAQTFRGGHFKKGMTMVFSTALTVLPLGNRAACAASITRSAECRAVPGAGFADGFWPSSAPLSSPQDFLASLAALFLPSYF
jgi:hypothetical protein